MVLLYQSGFYYACMQHHSVLHFQVICQECLVAVASWSAASSAQKNSANESNVIWLKAPETATKWTLRWEALVNHRVSLITDVN